jgi:membrane peptidoglycan carboxypeptidase
MAAVTPGTTGNQFNLVAQARRQPGSTFKVFVLTAAIEAGMDPNSTYYTSAPFHYQPDPYTPAWDVSTYDHTYAGTISVTSATLRSDNSVYAQLTLDVGPAKVAEMAHRLGIQSPLDDHGAYVPSIGLGSIPISPLDEASAYATLAAGGIYSKPMAIRRVVLASGKEDTDAGWGQPQQQRVLAQGVAWEVTQVLQQNVLGGTGVAAYFGRPAAGKTGTTENHADAWFSGYVPQLQATVWVGYPKGEIPMLNVHGIAVAGGTFPAQIWRLFMQQAVGRLAAKQFATPDHVSSVFDLDPGPVLARLGWVSRPDRLDLEGSDDRRRGHDRLDLDGSDDRRSDHDRRSDRNDRAAASNDDCDPSADRRTAADGDGRAAAARLDHSVGEVAAHGRGVPRGARA